MMNTTSLRLIFFRVKRSKFTGKPNSMTTAFLYDFMRKHLLAVVATVDENNRPESALVGIAVTPSLEIIFDTSANSRKAINLTHNAPIALVIGWDNEQTLQYEGTATQLAIADSADLLEIYFAAFPDGRERLQNMQDITYFLVKPTWVRYSDFNNFEIHEQHF